MTPRKRGRRSPIWPLGEQYEHPLAVIRCGSCESETGMVATAGEAPAVELVTVTVEANTWELANKAAIDRPVSYGTTGTGKYLADEAELDGRALTCGHCASDLRLPPDASRLVKKGRTKSTTIIAELRSTR